MKVDLSGMNDFALYTPAVNQSFAQFAARSNLPLFPDAQSQPQMGMNVSALNFLDPDNPFFHYDAGLYSAAYGATADSPNIISQRDRARTIVIGDSGGFSVIESALPYTIPQFRGLSLEYLERECDVGLILDEPTRSLSRAGNTGTFQGCLNTTLDSIQFALANRTSTSLTLLTVIQGRDTFEAQAWWDAVAPFQADFEGIALAGDTKFDFALLMENIIRMRDRNQLGNNFRWLHVLGTARPLIGLHLTGLQRAFRKHMNPKFRVSYDSSMAFRIVQVNKQLTTGITYDANDIKFHRYQIPNHWSGWDRSARFPFSSPLGDICRVGDFNPGNVNSQTGWNTRGIQMLSHHEVFKEVSALHEVNRLATAEAMPGLGHLPWSVYKSWEAFDAILSSSDPFNEIRRYRKYLGIPAPTKKAGAPASQVRLEDDER